MEENKKPERSLSSHTIAVQSFDGPIQIVQADQLRVCVPTKECIQFWFHMLAAVFAAAVGIVLMCVFRTGGLNDSAVFQAGVGLVTLGVGVLIPSPSYSSILPSTQQA